MDQWPAIGGVELDLAKLYRLVKEVGGCQAVENFDAVSFAGQSSPPLPLWAIALMNQPHACLGFMHHELFTVGRSGQRAVHTALSQESCCSLACILLQVPVVL